MSSDDIHYLDHPAFGVIIASEQFVLEEPQAQPADAQCLESETQPPPQLSNQIVSFQQRHPLLPHDIQSTQWCW